MKKLILTFLVFFNFSAGAEVRDCGEYRFVGNAKLKGRRFHLVINEHTASAYDIDITGDEHNRLAPFFNKSVQGSLQVTSVKGRNLKAKNLRNLLFEVKNPLKQNDLVFIKKMDCEK